MVPPFQGVCTFVSLFSCVDVLGAFACVSMHPLVRAYVFVGEHDDAVCSLFPVSLERCERCFVCGGLVWDPLHPALCWAMCQSLCYAGTRGMLWLLWLESGGPL